MNIDPMLFETWYNGEMVDQSSQMPRAAEEVNFIWTGPEEVHSSPDRQGRSSTRRRRRSPSPSPSSEIEPSTIYLEYQVGEGYWTLPVHLQDLNVNTWDSVNGAMIEAALIALYPGVFLRSNRVALAISGQYIRPTETLGQYTGEGAQLAVVSHGICAPLPELRHLICRRRAQRAEHPSVVRGPAGTVHGLPPMSTHFEALNLEAENGDEDTWLPLRNDPSHIRVAILGRGPPQLARIHLRPNRFQISMVEAVIKREYGDILGEARILLARRDGTILQPSSLINTDEEQILWAVAMDPLGAATQQPDPATILKEVLPHVQGRLKGNQIKLLLRGEQGLIGRVQKARFDPPKQAAILLNTAGRYGMHVGDAVTEKKTQKGPDTAEGAWTQVQRKSAKPVQVLSPESRGGNGSSRKVHKPEPTNTATEKKYVLKASQWSQSIMESFALDQPGVILAPTQDKAEKWALQIRGTKHAVAIISIQALQAATHVEKATIEILEITSEGAERPKVVTAYINSFGPQIIRHGRDHAQLSTHHDSSA